MPHMPMNVLKNGDISDPDVTGQVAALVESTKVITLASMSENQCWSAPVYYLYKPGGFYFFSSPRSRHIQNAQAMGGFCAASLFYDSPLIAELKGLQMQGFIESVSINPKSLAAAGEYAGKFNLAITSENVLAAITGKFRATFYRFVPKDTWYMNNQTGFGSRTRITL